VVYYCGAVMLFFRVAVKSKTAALQHRNTKNDALSLANQDFDIRISNFSLTSLVISYLRQEEM
jgi:hypothetical protein